MTDFTVSLKENFADLLDGFGLPAEVMGFTRDPFTVVTDGDFSSKTNEVLPSIDERKLLLDLVNMQPSVTRSFTLKGLQSFP